MRLALAWPDGCQLNLAVGTHHPLREHAADRRIFERPNQHPSNNPGVSADGKNLVQPVNGYGRMWRAMRCSLEAILRKHVGRFTEASSN